jgi:hypothetical protein
LPSADAIAFRHSVPAEARKAVENVEQMFNGPNGLEWFGFVWQAL